MAEPSAFFAPTVSLTVTADDPTLHWYSPTSCRRIFLTINFLWAPFETHSYFKMLNRKWTFYQPEVKYLKLDESILVFPLYQVHWADGSLSSASNTSMPESFPFKLFGTFANASVFCDAFLTVFDWTDSSLRLNNYFRFTSGYFRYLRSSLGTEGRSGLALVLGDWQLGGLSRSTCFNFVFSNVARWDILDNQFPEVTRPSLFVFQNA